LIDSRTATAVGGTGVPFDWQAARRSFAASHLRLIAAGGLNPENVAEAIHTLQPWGVDVVSGVEKSPGKKDSARVKAFISAAKAAAVEITTSSR
jgi:phosphoribosylanthranilate isomerase